ncbi:MAG: hypothetical protein ABI706_09670 [Ilumatobacteraceae bacterium]
MPTHPFDSDDDVLALLGDVLDSIEAPSASAVEGAEQLFALRQLDGDLMDLAADSNETSLAQRGTEAGRLLRFESGGCQIEIDAHFGDGVVTGQLTPGGVSAITTVTSAGASRFDSDALGRFLQPIAGRGLHRWSVRFADGRICVTPIVRL